MYMGRRYYVSVRRLGIKPETKEASVHAANAWWRAKQAELDYAYTASHPPLRTPRPAEDIASALLGSKEDWPTALRDLLLRLPAFGYPDISSPVDEEGAATVLKQALGDLLLRSIVDGEPLPPSLAECLPPVRTSAVERAVREIRGEQAADTSRTVKTMADNWFRGQKVQVMSKGLSPDRADAARRFLAPFVAFVGETADVGTVNAETLTGFYHFVLSKIGERHQNPQAGWGTVYSKEIFQTARSWIRWLVEQGAITAPPNLAAKFRFGSTVKRVQVWTADEVRGLIREAPGNLKLCVLLCLNCGMTQGDVSDLLDDEVDWREGRVFRKRSKTAHKDSVPTVNYKLWPETFALLKEYRSGKDRVLMTDAGNPFMRKKMQDGKLVKVDGFARKWAKLRKRLGLKKPMKLLRKTSASLLESHETYGRFTSLFLGHSPKSMKDRYYAAPPQELFDKAVLWLGEQLRLVE
jgi:integrase